MYRVFSRGLLGSNTYLAYDEASREAMIIDCGNAVREVRALVREAALTVKYIVLTHAHYDHAEFFADYRAAFPEAEALAHASEVALMNDAEANVSLYFGAPRLYGYPDRTLKDGDVLRLGDVEYRVISTPGHTPGSICLYSAAEGVMFTGDTLFCAGRGRCDFKFGSEDAMRSSLARLFAMDGEITVLSGHGAPTKIAAERGRVF